MTPQERAVQEFQRRFGAAPSLIVRAPGRVNLIGEHTDYNDGFVLPMAIDRAIWIALRARDDRRVVAHTLDLDDNTEFALEALKHTDGGWSEYLKGVAWAIQEEGYAIGGWEGVVAGDVPIGAGLASSAALELATARAFAAVSGLPWHPPTMARICQRAENEWVGIRCGIMDQMISAAGEASHALLIDCRSLQRRPVPLPSGVVVAVLDTGSRRSLVDSAYNERRNQCEAAARFFGVPALRDVSLPELEARADELKNQLGEVIYRRARHVVTENARTLDAIAAMERGDLVALGSLLDASHISLRDDFEVSGKELDALASCARWTDGCHGARMIGAGFGGCAVALVRTEAAASFSARVAACYEAATGIPAAITMSRAAPGAAVVTRSGTIRTDDAIRR